eukprot:gene3933-7143_t
MKLQISGADPVTQSVAYMMLTPLAIGLEAKELYIKYTLAGYFSKRKRKKLHNQKEEEFLSKKQNLLDFLNENQKEETIEKEYFEKLKDLSFDSQISNEKKEILHLNYATENIELENFQKALLHCEEILKISPKNYFSHFLLSNIYNKLGLAQESINHSKKSIFYYNEVISSEVSSAINEKMEKDANSPPKKPGFIKRRLKRYKREEDDETIKEEKKLGFFKKRLKKYRQQDEEGSNSPIKEDICEPIRFLLEEDLILYHISNLLTFEYYVDLLDFMDEMSDHFEKGFKSFTCGTCYYNLSEITNAIFCYKSSFEEHYQQEKSIEMIIMCYRRLGNFEKAKFFQDKYPNLKVPECHISLLPTDEFNHIFQFMDVSSLINLSSTSKNYRKAICESKQVKGEITISSANLEKLHHYYLEFIYTGINGNKNLNYILFIEFLTELIFQCPLKYMPISLPKFPSTLHMILSEGYEWLYLIHDSFNNKDFIVDYRFQVIKKKDLILFFLDNNTIKSEVENK